MTKTISSSHRLSPQLDEHPDLTSIASQNPSQTVDEVTLDVQLQVVHAIAGRVRIRTIDGSWNSQIEHLSQELKQQSWVLKISANENTGSLIFTFDENQLPLPQVLQVLTEFDVKYTPSATKLDLAEIKSPGFWQKQSNSIIPLIAGLLVTRGLKVSGLPAILVYMIAADGTRWLMDSLDTGLFTAVMGKTAQKLTQREILLPGLKKVEKKSIAKTATSEKIDYQIVHQISGRIRFHLPQITQDTAYAKKLEKLLKTDAEVSNFRVNYQAESVLINYHHPETNITHWVNLMELAR
ncbi:hypothetical protein A0J48_025200 [Sphaerospermopsis aphanizomenoides BCCUSP55]|uniref:HMA2 domain-containing protein n=1 Tax=Sphaerospermopsis aphanizomenoides TaxID=459663 RepID=UPI001905266A|nr:hypothetical protein [Sphaerospermopsis aphanizomenoides]MBK1990768.1 hypothetical protein [Sphaerospermopsis aphanizomenoides BCCUSP55]